VPLDAVLNNVRPHARHAEMPVHLADERVPAMTELGRE